MISFIILNHNNRVCIGKCIDSVMKYSEDTEHEIIVVDNWSTDGSCELLRSVYGNRIQLLENTVNGQIWRGMPNLQRTVREELLCLKTVFH